MEEIEGIRKGAEVIDKKFSPDEVYSAVQDVLFDDFDVRTAKNGREYKVPVRRFIDFAGHQVKGNSQRLQTFFTKGDTCPCCGAKGEFYILLRHSDQDRFHFEFIGRKSDGGLVLMTKDHIIPKSKGGRNLLDNYQPMCVTCNMKKGDSLK